MPKQVIITPEAQMGIRAIATFIARQTGSQQRGDAYRIRVLRSLKQLLVFPQSAPLADVVRDPNLRKRVIDKLTIAFYRLVKEGILVEAIVDARTDWPSTL